jgi:biotin-(acetyl-CoA carboxylase) ligase
MGVNVKWPERRTSEVGTRATSIEAELGHDRVPVRAALLGEILAAFESIYETHAEEGAGRELVARASARSAVLGTDVSVLLGDGSRLAGRAARLGDGGELVVHTKRGEVEIAMGEIERLYE